MLYGFAARGIQDYLFRSNKLKEIIGASELIETLPGDSVFDVLVARVLGAQNYHVLTRAAGGVRMICDDGTQAQELAKLWPLVAARYAPGLELTQAIVPLGTDLMQAIQALEQQLAINRQSPCAMLPEAGPLVVRNRRTGLPADRRDKDADDESVPLDAESARKLQVQKDAKERLLKRLWPEAKDKQAWKFPDDFDKLVGERDYLAIVHADANGMGVALNELTEQQLKGKSLTVACAAYRGFSQAVAVATQTALCHALEALIPAWIQEDPKKYFARPIVCAGDDLTVVLRSRDAFRFAELYAQKLEDQSAQEIGNLEVKPRQALTTSVAILCIRPGYPFRRAYDLLESMCTYAKKKSERNCSSLIFARVTAEAPESFDDLIEQELTTPGSVLTMQPYRLGRQAGPIPDWSSLQALKKAVCEMPRGSFRETLRQMYLGRAHADRAFQRLCDVAKPDKADSLRQALRDLETTDGGLWRKTEQDEQGQPLCATPLYDVLELQALEG
jgi:hypothetical protein